MPPRMKRRRGQTRRKPQVGKSPISVIGLIGANRKEPKMAEGKAFPTFEESKREGEGIVKAKNDAHRETEKENQEKVTALHRSAMEEGIETAKAPPQPLLVRLKASGKRRSPPLMLSMDVRSAPPRRRSSSRMTGKRPIRPS